MMSEQMQKTAGGTRRWLKILGFTVAFLGLLVVGAYLVLTSGWFFKTVLLPKAGEAMQAKLTAEEAQLSPWSGVSMRGFKMETTGAVPLLGVRQISVRYSSLSDLLKGRIFLDEITVDGLEVRLEEVDGRNNWDSLGKGRAASAQAPASSPAPEVLIKKIVLSNATLSYSQGQSTQRQVMELSGLQLTVENLGNGQTAALRSQGNLRWRRTEGASADELTCPLQVEAQVALDAGLMPGSAKGRLLAGIKEAAGLLLETRGLDMQMNWDWTPTEIRQLALAFSRSNQPLAALEVHGPFDPARGEGRLQFALDRVGGQVLNLVAATAGLNIPQATLSAQGRLELAGQFQNIKAAGLVEALQVCVAQGGQVTPPTDLRLRYAVDVQRAKEIVAIQELGLTAALSNRPMVQATLARPMMLTWGTAQAGGEESEFLLTVERLDLAPWRALFPDLDLAGQVDLRALVQSRSAGQTLAVDARGSVQNLHLKVDTNTYTAQEIQLEARTLTTQFQRTALSHFTVRYLERAAPVVTLSATGQVDHARQEYDLTLSSDTALPQVASLAGLTNAAFSAGTLQFQGQVTQKNHAPTNAPVPLLTQSIVSTWRLAGLTGHYGDLSLQRLEAVAESDLVLTNNLLVIRKFQARAAQGGQPAGAVQVAGFHHLTQTNGQLSLHFSNVNERLFQSAAVWLGSNRLESARLDGALQVAYAPARWSATGEVRVDRLLVMDAAGSWPRTPLATEMVLDVSQQAAVWEARRLQARFQQGGQAAGAIELSGQWDAARTNGQFKARIQGLNENALRPWLAAVMGPVSLEKVHIEADAEGRYQAGAQMALQATMQVTNLLLRDVAGQMPREPLALALKLDAASQRPNHVELRSASVQLSPTARAANRLQAEGQLDLANPSAITGRLAVVAESLDWTPYHQVYKALMTTNPATAAAPPTQNEEAPAMTLPLTNFVVTAQAQRLYWEELAMTNLTAWVRVDGPRLLITNLAATVNGASARGRVALNLGVPGYQYDVDVQLQRLPLAPLAATFMAPSPDPWQGDLSLALAVKGTGSTGPNLRRHLSGHFQVDVTNAALRIKSLLTPSRGAQTTTSQQFLRVLVGILDPLLNAVGGALGVPNLVAQPFDTSRLQLEFGQGNIQLRDFTLANSTIIVGSRGHIPMADVLMASPLDLPVEISLAGPLAQRLQIISSAPAGASHVKLPDFVVVRGTLENPQTRLNTKVITGTALQRVGKEVGGEAGTLLQGLGNILGGGTRPVTNAPAVKPATPPPAPNTNAPINNLINDLFRPRPQK